MFRPIDVEGVTLAHHHVVRDRYGRVLEEEEDGFGAHHKARRRARELTKDLRTDFPPCYDDTLVDGESYYAYNEFGDVVQKRHRHKH